MADPPRPARSFRRVVANDEADLEQLASHLAGHPVVAVDIEMGQRVNRLPGGVQEWTHVLALVQLAAGDLSVIVDPLRCEVAPLGPLMAGSARKIVLGGGQDVALLARAGIPLHHIVDVGEAAYALFGRREDGMAALSQRIFGISLDKTIRRTDWLIRPLNPVLLAYAFRDPELTLMIYEWMQEVHPGAISLHERAEFEPAPPPGTPEWLVQATARPADAVATVMASGMAFPGDEDSMSAAVVSALQTTTAPRQVNKLLRVVGELGLTDVIPQVLPYTASLSSLLRASAARALGQAGEPGVAEPALRVLAQDPIEDVRKAAAVGLRDLRSRQQPAKIQDESDAENEAATLDLSTLAALEHFKAQLEQTD